MFSLISVRTFHTSAREGVSLTLSLVAIAAGVSESDTSPSLSWTVEGPSILDEPLNFFLFLLPDFVILELIQHFNLLLPSQASELTNTRPSSAAARPSLTPLMFLTFAPREEFLSRLRRSLPAFGPQVFSLSMPRENLWYPG